MAVVRGERDERGALELRGGTAHRDHPPDPAEDPPLHREQVVAAFVVVAGVARAVDPAGVVRGVRALVPVDVVALTHLVTQVEQWHPAGTHGQRMREQDPVHGRTRFGLEPQQGRGGAADPAVPRAGIVLERHTVREAPGVAPGVEGVEEAAVVVAVNTQASGIVVGERPPDVVVAAHVVDPRGARGCLVTFGERSGEQGDVPGGHGLPREGHLQGVVGQRALVRVDVADDLVRVDDRLRLELHGRGGQGRHGVERAQQVVDLWLGLARGAQLLPDERHGVQAQHLGPLVRQEQHFRGHGVEDVRVGVVEVPLEAVERGPHPPGIRVVGARVPSRRRAVHAREHPGVVVREDLPRGALELVRHGALRVHPVEAFVERVPGGRGPGPLVLVGGVVEHEVQHQGDPVGPQLGGQVREIRHGPQVRVHPAVGGHRVPPVRVAGGALVEGHEVQVGQPEFLEVRNLLPDPREVPTVAVHVTHPAHGLPGREPRRPLLPVLVQFLELPRALHVGLPRGEDGAGHGVPDAGARSVDRVQGGDQTVELTGEPVEEHGAFLGGRARIQREMLTYRFEHVFAIGGVPGDRGFGQHGNASSVDARHMRGESWCPGSPLMPSSNQPPARLREPDASRIRAWSRPSVR